MFVKPRRVRGTTLTAVVATGAGTAVDFGAEAPVRDVRYFIKATAVTTGATIKWEVSYDNVTWFVFGSSVAVGATGNTSAGITTAGVGAPRYWRANVTSYTDGTYTVALQGDRDY